MVRELAPRLDNSDLSDGGESGMSLADASSYLYDALISPFETELERVGFVLALIQKKYAFLSKKKFSDPFNYWKTYVIDQGENFVDQMLT